MNSKNIPFLLSILLFIFLTVFLFQPGYMDNDSLDQLEQGRNGVYNDWHPPAMSWVWAQIGRILPGSLGMFLLQVILFWTGLGILIYLISPTQMGRILYLLIGFFPPVFMLLSTVLKDVFMAAVLLFGLSLILLSERRKSLTLLILGMLFIGYGSLIRHNAIAAVLPLFIYGGFSFTKLKPMFMNKIAPVWRSVIVGCVSFVFLYIAGRVWNDHITNIRTYPFQQVMLHDLAGISIRTKTYLIPEYLAMTKQPSMMDLKRIFHARSMKNLYWPDFTDIHFKILQDPLLVKALFNTWMMNIVDHPRAYLLHRSAVFTGVLNLTTSRTCGPYYYEGTIYKPKGIAQPNGDYYSDHPVINLLFTWVEPFRDSFIYLNWVYVLASLLLFLISLLMILKYRPEEKPLAVIVLALSTSGSLYGLAYFFVATSCDFRMVYWNVMVTLVSFVLLLQAQHKHGPVVS